MATSSTYTVKLPKILDIIEYNGFFNLPNVRITISDRDTGNVLYNDIPTTGQISFSTAIGADLRITASKGHYKSEVRAVYLGNPENGVYRFIKRANDKELVIIALNREEGYCGSGEKMIDYVHAFYTRKFNDFTLTEPQKVLVSSSAVARDLTSKLNVCLTNPLSLPSDINTFKNGFVAELNDQDDLHTIYVKGPSNEDETDLNYVWGSNHAYIFEDAFKLHVIEKNREYLTFEAYDSNVDEFSVKLMQYGTPNSAVIQYRYFDKDSGKSINSTGGTTYIVTSNEMTQIRGSFATGKTCTISSARVNFTLYDRISCNGVVYDVEETEDGGYRLVESTTDYEWTDYTFGTLLTSNDNGVVIQFRRSPENDSHYFSKNSTNFYYFDVTNGYVNVYGSVNTLLVASDNITLDETDNNDKYIFYRLFGYQHPNRIKRVKDLKLKSTVLTEGCYAYMFNGCDFTEPPIIDAETVRANSCESMFASNSSLTSLPNSFFVFRISNLYDYSYGGMFYNCTNLSLHTSQVITVDSCGIGSCNSMFKECTKNRHCNVTIGPKTALNVPERAFYEMFYNNTNASLSYIKISATNVGKNGFAEMFYNCNNMVFPDDLSEYWLYIGGNVGTNGCYKMFESCSSLKNESTISLSLFTTSVGVSGCCRMFYGCSSLKIPAFFPNHASDLTTNSYCFSKMFYGCDSLVLCPSIRVSSLANYACESMFYDCRTIKDASSVFSTNNGLTFGQYSCQYMFYNCKELQMAPYLQNSTLGIGCFSHMFENCENLKSFEFGSFASTSIPNYAFEYTFKNAGIERVGNWSNITTAGDYSCQYMFSDSKLKYPPTKGAITLGIYSYYYMFENCDLYSDMELRASTIPNHAYEYMFTHATINNFRNTFKVTNFTSCGDYSFGHMFYYAKSRTETGGIVCGKFMIKRVNAVNPYYVKLFQSRAQLRDSGAKIYNKFKNNHYYWVLPYRDAFIDSDHIALVTSDMSWTEGVESIQTGGGSYIDWIVTTDLRYSNGDKFELSEFLSSSETACTVYDRLNNDYSAFSNGEYHIVKKDIDYAIKFGSNTTGIYCCEYMFSHCEFVKDGYMVRFTGTKLGNYAFSHMFDSAPNLNSIPRLNDINSFGNYSLEYMFANCNGLVQISDYNKNDVSLSNYRRKIVDLVRARTSYNSTNNMYYYYIFKTTISSIPTGCCKGMFKGCKNLMYGPVIQNITPNSGAYEEMFCNCSILQKMRYERTSAPTSTHFLNWVKNVRSSGDFSRSSTWTITYGDSGVPTGWNVDTD